MSEREGERGREGEGRGGPPRRLSKPIFGISFGKHNVLRTLFMGSIRNLSPPVIPRCIPIPKGKGGAPYDAATDTPIGEFDPVTFGDLGLSDTEALIHSNIRLMSAFVSRIYRAYFFLFSLLNL